MFRSVSKVTIVAIDYDPCSFREKGATMFCHRIEVDDAFGNKIPMYLRGTETSLLKCINVGKVSIL